MGGSGVSFGNWFSNGDGASGAKGHYQNAYSADPCRLPHRQAPIPRGCHPSQVTYGPSPSYGGNAYGPAGSQGGSYAGGFPQKPQFGAPSHQGHPQYATGGYGSHAAGNQYTQLHQGGNGAQKRRPRFRGALDLGIDRSVSGDILTNAAFPTEPFTGYNPANYNEARTEGSIAQGEVTDYRYYVNSRLQNTPDPWDDLQVPDVSFADAWSAPTTIGASGEFILSDRATLFGRVGYSQAEGTSGGAATIEGTVFKETTIRSYNSEYNLVGTSVSTEFQTEQQIAEISYDFSDMKRLDLEVGGRVYLEPIAGVSTGRTITPFLGASAGATHYNAVSYSYDQRQLGYRSVYEDEENSYYDLDVPGGYDIDNDPATPNVTRVDLYEAQWVPAGGLQAGMEWQLSPKTALAFETGVRVEGPRDYANGAKSSRRVSVPFTLRGSFNF
jgi:hypothetical protein